MSELQIYVDQVEEAIVFTFVEPSRGSSAFTLSEEQAIDLARAIIEMLEDRSRYEIIGKPDMLISEEPTFAHLAGLARLEGVSINVTISPAD